MGKIFNKALAWGFFIGLIIFAFFGFRERILLEISNLEYFRIVLINSLAALMFGYFFWNQKMWSAGDAKLLFFYSTFIPISFYSNNFINFFPSINLLINTFLLFLSFLLLKFIVSLFKNKKEQKILTYDKILSSAKNLFSVFLTFVFILFIFELAGETRLVPSFMLNPFFAFLLIFIFYQVIVKNKIWQIIVGLASVLIIVYLLLENVSLLQQILSKSFIFVVIIGLTRIILQAYLEKNETKSVNVEDIKPGAIIVESDLSALVNKMDEKSRDDFDNHYGYGVNAKQVEIIKSLFKNENVRVHNSFSLAPLILLSAALTIFVQGSILLFVIDLIKSI